MNIVNLDHKILRPRRDENNSEEEKIRFFNLRIELHSNLGHGGMIFPDASLFPVLSQCQLQIMRISNLPEYMIGRLQSKKNRDIHNGTFGSKTDLIDISI